MNVDIFDSKTYVQNVHADEFRQDLLDAGYGNGRHAFHIATPERLKDGRTHKVYARVAETKKELDGSPEFVTCP